MKDNNQYEIEGLTSANSAQQFTKELEQGYHLVRFKRTQYDGN